MDKKIIQLTEEQLARLPDYVREWTDIGLSTEPADRPRAEAAINWMYAQAGLPAPTIIWTGSPLGSALYRALLCDVYNGVPELLAGEEYDEAVKEAAEQVGQQLCSWSWHAASEQVASQADLDVQTAVQAGVEEALWRAQPGVYGQIQQALEEAAPAIRRVLQDKPHLKAAWKVNSAADSASRVAVSAQVMASVAAAADASQTSVHDAVGEALKTVWQAQNVIYTQIRQALEEAAATSKQTRSFMTEMQDQPGARVADNVRERTVEEVRVDVNSGAALPISVQINKLLDAVITGLGESLASQLQTEAGDVDYAIKFWPLERAVDRVLQSIDAQLWHSLHDMVNPNTNTAGTLPVNSGIVDGLRADAATVGEEVGNALVDHLERAAARVLHNQPTSESRSQVRDGIQQVHSPAPRLAIEESLRDNPQMRSWQAILGLTERAIYGLVLRRVFSDGGRIGESITEALRAVELPVVGARVDLADAIRKQAGHAASVRSSTCAWWALIAQVQTEASRIVRRVESAIVDELLAEKAVPREPPPAGSSENVKEELEQKTWLQSHEKVAERTDIHLRNMVGNCLADTEDAADIRHDIQAELRGNDLVVEQRQDNPQVTEQLTDADREVWERIGHAVESAIQLIVDRAVWDTVAEAVGGAVASAISETLQDNHEIRKQLLHKCGCVGACDETRNQVATDIWFGIAEKVQFLFDDQLRIVSEALPVAMAQQSVPDSPLLSVGGFPGPAMQKLLARVQQRMQQNIENSVRASVSASIYGQHDAGWLAFYQVFHDFGLETETSCLHGLWELARSAGWAIPHKNICWVSDRAETIRRDEQGRLHCEDGPAMRFRDGWSLWRWHGVAVDEQIILRPETQTLEQIREEENAEKKRVRIERFGWERYLQEAGAEVIDERRNDVEGTQEALMLADDMQVLVCHCPSTGRVYALEVPLEIRTCEQAQAYLWSGSRLLEDRKINIIGRT